MLRQARGHQNARRARKEKEYSSVRCTSVQALGVQLRDVAVKIRPICR